MKTQTIERTAIIPRCERCFSDDIAITSSSGDRYRYRCHRCGHVDSSFNVKHYGEPGARTPESATPQAPIITIPQPAPDLQLTAPGAPLTVNTLAAMAGLSVHTQRAYGRWILRYLSDVTGQNGILQRLDVHSTVSSLHPALLKSWLGSLKESGLGKQSIGQAKAAVVWLAQFLADLSHVDYSLPAALSRVKAPRAESGRRAGVWLDESQVRALIRALPLLDSSGAAVARNTAIILLMVLCGLRRDEITTITWADIATACGNAVLRVHGKGEKLRTVKLPAMAVQALEGWKPFHPQPEGRRAVFTQVRKNGRVLTAPLAPESIRNFVSKAAQRAGLPNVGPHDLRRSFARGAYQAGVSFELIRQSLGHSNIATTEHYVSAALELDNAATDIWAHVLEDE